MNRVCRVSPTKDFNLLLEYTDGIFVLVDFAPIIQKGTALMPLQDPEFFSQVSLEEKGRYIYWQDEIEFCVDALRLKGKIVNQDTVNYSQPAVG
jgi:hypothetical protein